MSHNGVCSEYEDALVLYHYGELGPEDTARVESHMASCASCREELASIASTLAHVPTVHPMEWESAKAVHNVMDSVRPSKRIWTSRLVPAYIAAAAAVVAVVLSVYSPTLVAMLPTQTETALAQADWEVVENYEVVKDLDVIEVLDNLDSFGDGQ